MRFINETSPESPLKVLTSGTYRGPSRDPQGTNTKTDDLIKIFFSEVKVLALYMYFCFLQEEQIFKSSKWGRPRDVYRTQFLDGLGIKWLDVRGTSKGRCFLNSTHKHIKVSQVTQDCKVNGSGEKFIKQYSG